MKSTFSNLIFALCLSFTALAANAQPDLSGSYVIDHENGNFTFIIKRIAPIDIAMGVEL